jgi:hypothetical protein
MIGTGVELFQDSLDEVGKIFCAVEVLEEEVGGLVGQVAKFEAQFNFGETGWRGG